MALGKKQKIAPRVLYMKNGKIGLEFTLAEYKVLKDNLHFLYNELDTDNNLRLKGTIAYKLWKNDDRFSDYVKNDIKNSVLLRQIDDTLPFAFDDGIALSSNTSIQSAYHRARVKGTLINESYYDDNYPLGTYPRDFEVFRKSYLKKNPSASFDEIREAYILRAKAKK